MVNLSSCWKRLSPVGRGFMIAACTTILLCTALLIAVGVLASNTKLCDADTDGFLDGESSKLLGISPTPCVTDACINFASDILSNMNASVHPCNDFYKFVCGNYIASNPIPDDKSRVDGFSAIEDRLMHQLRLGMEGAIEPSDPKFVKLVKILYQSCMDKKTIKEQGMAPLVKLLRELGGWPVVEGDDWNEDDFHWMNATYKFRDKGLPIDIFIGFRIDIDLKDNQNRVIYIDQPSFGLFYEILVDGMSPKVMRAYVKFMTDVAVLLGASEETVGHELTESLLLEVALAEVSLSKDERRAVKRLYNPMTIDGLTRKYPSIPWKEYLNRILAPKASVEDDETVILQVPGYIHNLENIIAETPKRVQANYMMWRAIVASLPYLDEDFRNTQFGFERSLSGQSARSSRWTECVHIVTSKLSLAVGALYVRHNFDQQAKNTAVEMVRAISRELRVALHNVKWMDGYTRRNALQKASAMTSHVAYPDELMNDKKLDKFYKKLELTGGSYLENALNLSRFDQEYSLSGLRRPFNKSDWRNHGNAATVNAFYSPIENSINIPAAILQGRFFSNDRPKYANYAGIGFVIGHEITHGFDDMGRYFDKDGNVIDWWTPSSERKFHNRVQCIINQYNNYVVPEVKKRLDGKNTRNENIADTGGLKLAYLAYTKWALQNEREKFLPGLYFTPRQLFWISMANSWCAKYRHAYLRLMILEDPHCPAEFRILGPFSNLIEFAHDFKCPKGSRMNPTNKCRIW